MLQNQNVQQQKKYLANVMTGAGTSQTNKQTDLEIQKLSKI